VTLEADRLRMVEAGAGDAPVLQACLEAAPDYVGQTEGGPPAPGAASDLLADAEADPARRVFLLYPRAGWTAVGVLDLHLDYPGPGEAHIGLLLLRDAWQGMGYGREVASALERSLGRAGFRALRLAVTDENVGARLFWERIGFAEVGRLDGGVTLYEKPLRR